MDVVDLLFGIVIQVWVFVQVMVCYVKKNGIILVLVGYVIKDGQIVGLCVVEYMVDVVFYFEGDGVY